MRQKWGVHMCVLDRTCRRHAGWVWRLQVNTPWWHLGIALAPASRYVGKGDGAYWTSFTRHTKTS